MKLPSVDTMLTQIEETMAQYEKDIAESKMIDMHGFEENVKKMCDTLGSLPLSEAAKYQARLTDISRRLEEMFKVLLERREQIRKEIASLDKGQQAQSAYSKTNKMPGLNKKPPQDTEE
ncbi:MAG: hypothetical protein EB060_02815 [Proteobacteria bacterium]|nr:hypothetical protein [Pseudomonadota bacterium]